MSTSTARCSTRNPLKMRGHWFPLFQIIILPVCCMTTYIWSVMLGHVSPGFPYISDTGTYPPECCLFGLLFGLYSFATLISVYLRWQQIHTFYTNEGSRIWLHRGNNLCLFMGIIGAFGVFLVANFQLTNVLVVHMIGADTAFSLGIVYCWLQTFMSYNARELPGAQKCMRHLRLSLAFMITAAGIMEVAFGQLARYKRGNVQVVEMAILWKPDENGFKEHVISTGLEWFLAFMTTFYFGTFIEEFKQFTVTMPIEFKVTGLSNSDVHADTLADGQGHGEGHLSCTELSKKATCSYSSTRETVISENHEHKIVDAGTNSGTRL